MDLKVPSRKYSNYGMLNQATEDTKTWFILFKNL